MVPADLDTPYCAPLRGSLVTGVVEQSDNIVAASVRAITVEGVDFPPMLDTAGLPLESENFEQINGSHM